MTTKTHYAMFALAAIAVMGVGFAPAAFAAGAYASEQVTAPSSGWASSGNDTPSCGTGTCFAKVEVSATADDAKIWYGMYGSNNTCDVTSYTYGMGAVQTENWGTISGLHSYQYNNMGIDSGDKITVVNVYSNCT